MPTLILFITTLAYAQKPVVTKLHGHRHCTQVKGSFWGCTEVPGNFTYEVSGNKMKLDTQSCEGTTLRYRFSFAGDCLISVISPENGNADLAQVQTREGCTGYFRCADLN